MDKDGNAVDPDKLSEHFTKDGVYKNSLYKLDATGAAVQIGAEQIDNYVETTREKVETTRGALELRLHAGADSEDTNKISVVIESMDATSLGLKADGKAISLSTEDDATNSRTGKKEITNTAAQPGYTGCAAVFLLVRDSAVRRSRRS